MYKSLKEEDNSLPSAPPPSPSLGCKRKPCIIPISTLLDLCCEELAEKASRIDLDDRRNVRSYTLPAYLPVKRKSTELDLDVTLASKIGGHICSVPVGKKSRSSLTANLIQNHSRPVLVSSVNSSSIALGSTA